LPKRFHCDNLALTHYFGANIYSRYDGIVTNYAPGQNGGLMPELRGPVSVQDRRIRDQNLGNHMWRRDVTSILHNDAWIIDTNDAMIHSAAKFPSATRYIVVAVVARRQNECLIGQAVFWLCMISLPVILLWKHIKSRPKSAEIFRPTD
jgi:hypothetical protein